MLPFHILTTADLVVIWIWNASWLDCFFIFLTFHLSSNLSAKCQRRSVWNIANKNKTPLWNIFRGVHFLKRHHATQSALSGDLPGSECKCWFIAKINEDEQSVKETENKKQAGSGDLQTECTNLGQAQTIRLEWSQNLSVKLSESRRLHTEQKNSWIIQMH